MSQKNNPANNIRWKNRDSKRIRKIKRFERSLAENQPAEALKFPPIWLKFFKHFQEKANSAKADLDCSTTGEENFFEQKISKRAYKKLQKKYEAMNEKSNFWLQKIYSAIDKFNKKGV